MSDFENSDSKNGFFMKLWRGERMCLLGFDVENPEPDFVGFAIERKEPGMAFFEPLLNRLAFSYDKPATTAVTGRRQFPSNEAPFQKFRWIHFPRDPKDGKYTYRATKMHMPDPKKKLRAGTSIELDLSLEQVSYHNFLDVGFTRNFASSQAFIDNFAPDGDVEALGKTLLPRVADEGLEFKKMRPDIYKWLGFEATDMVFAMLDQAVKDPKLTLDVLAYDLNEPELVAKLEKLKSRLRIVVDDSISKTKDKETGEVDESGHGHAESAESRAVERLIHSAGASNVRRTHFKNLQHHKVLIAKRNGKPFQVLTGSTNFSFRGFYIQANNAIVFTNEPIAKLFSEMFEEAFARPGDFSAHALASKWHSVQSGNKPKIEVCFSPHKDTDLSLRRVGDAIDGAQSAVIYAVAFLNQIQSGAGRTALDKLMSRTIFSHGVSDKRGGGLQLQKPDGSTGLVDFAHMGKNAPEPFRSEWRGGKGINVHHKFVVTDFNLPTAKVFMGSCNLAPAGEKNNGDHLILIEDRKVAASYAIEGVRVFDHLHFRDVLRDAQEKKKAGETAKATKALTLRKPRAVTGEAAWFERFYKAGSQLEKDRLLFSR